MGLAAGACVSDPAESGGGADRDDGAVVAGTYVVGCDRFTIGEEFGPLLGAHGVDGGTVAPEPCFGVAVPEVVTAWRSLASVAPPSLVEAVDLVAGYEPNDSGTLAYAGPIDDDTEGFLIAVDVEAAADDPGELELTMAHELSHVFTQVTSQLDVAVFADECDTLFNGIGCFQPDAYITSWIDEFWDPTELAALPADGATDEVGGEARCAADPSFVGSYAASHPEEDFAESFAAYVFDVPVPTSVEPRMAFFERYDEFRSMRDAIASAGRSRPAVEMDGCG